MEMRGKNAGMTELETNFKQHFKNLPSALAASAERSEMFWQRQQAAIRSRIAIDQASRRPWVGFVWVTVASLLLLASLAIHSSPPLPKATQQIDPDQQLLVSVEQAIHSGVPQALEPAAMLADEISQVTEPVSATHPSGKEKPSEN
jgi:hypothetical protein